MKPPTKREYLRDLVAERNRCHRSLTDEEKALGFLGRHQRGYLPHCDYPGIVQFLTIRLWDSMPQSSRAQWAPLLAIENDRERRTKLEDYLDRGLGACHLRKSRVAKLAENALLHFHNSRYELLAWCVMPNHIHVLVHVWQWPLWKMVWSWKKFIASKAETLLTERRPPARLDHRPNSLQTLSIPISALRVQRLRWQREYWDTFMRDEKQEQTAVRYIENNPIKALLCRKPEEWQFGSARFRDKYVRLMLPNGDGQELEGAT